MHICYHSKKTYRQKKAIPILENKVCFFFFPLQIFKKFFTLRKKKKGSVKKCWMKDSLGNPKNDYSMATLQKPFSEPLFLGVQDNKK